MGGNTFHSAVGGYPSENVIRFVARNYYSSDRSETKILDFGCGAGAHTWYLAREGFQTYAFDGSESAVKNTKDKLKKEGLYANVNTYDALNIPYREAFFDAIIDSACITANILEDAVEMYKKCFSILKPGGRMLTVVFGKRTTGYGEGTEIEYGTYTDIKKGNLAGVGKVHFYTLDEMAKLLKDLGFDVIYNDTSLYSDRGNFVENILIQCQRPNSFY